MTTTAWLGVGYQDVIRSLADGQPIPEMVKLVRSWLPRRQVRIVTPLIHPLNCCVMPNDKRVGHATWIDNNREDLAWEHIESIRRFCVKNLGVVLPITNVIDRNMICLWDNNVEQVEERTGRRAVDVAFELGQGK